MVRPSIRPKTSALITLLLVGKNCRMKLTVLLPIILLTAGCDLSVPIDPLLEQCNQAESYGDRYGTPDSPGPCWERTIGHTVGFGSEIYQVRIRGTQYGVASLMYRNGVMISASSVVM